MLVLFLALLSFFFSLVYAALFQFFTEPNLQNGIFACAYSSFLIAVIVSFFVGPYLFTRNRKLIELGSKYPDVASLVRSCSETIRLSKPPTAYLVSNTGDACLVFGRTNNGAKLILGEEFLKSMSRDDLRTVILHELSHIRNRDVAFWTWGQALVKALELWFVVAYVFLIAGVVIVGSKLNMSPIHWVTSFIFTFFILVAFPVVIMNSISKLRESLADARVLATLDSNLPIFSAIGGWGSWMLQDKVGSSEKGGKIEELKSSISRIVDSNRIVSTIIAKFCQNTPSLRERIENLQTKKFLVSKDMDYIPSLENAVYAGVMGCLVQYGIVLPVALVGVTFFGATPENSFVDVLVVFLPGIVISLVNCFGLFHLQAFRKKTTSSIFKRNVLSASVFAILTVLIMSPVQKMSYILPVVALSFILQVLVSLLVTTSIGFSKAIAVYTRHKRQTLKTRLM
jgi:Zn-dependent protease with chaperone function